MNMKCKSGMNSMPRISKHVVIYERPKMEPICTNSIDHACAQCKLESNCKEMCTQVGKRGGSRHTCTQGRGRGLEPKLTRPTLRPSLTCTPTNCKQHTQAEGGRHASNGGGGTLYTGRTHAHSPLPAHGQLFLPAASAATLGSAAVQ